MQKKIHTTILKKKVKNLKGFLKDDTIKKYVDINKQCVLKQYMFDLSYLMKIFLVLSLLFLIDYFYHIVYSDKENV